MSNLIAGLAQGFAQGQQQRLQQEKDKEMKNLQVKLFKKQLDMQDEKKAAEGKLMELLAPLGVLENMGDFAENSGAPIGKMPGKTLKDVLSTGEGQQAALGAGYKLDDIRQFQTPSITDLLASGGIPGLSGGMGGLQVSGMKLDPSGRPMIDFVNPEASYNEQAARERAKRESALLDENTKKSMQAGNMTELINQAKGLLNDASGSVPGTVLSAGKQALGFSDKTTQANQRLQLISGWLVANVPRMEGPQSNFDVQNYQIMAGVVGDSRIPIKDRMAALDSLLQLQKKYTGGNTPKAEDPLGIR